MNADIRVSISLPRHWKYRKLKRLIGCSPMEYLIVFWGTVAEQVPNGVLNGWSTDDVEDAAGWDGEPGVFCQGIIDSGFLDTIDGGYSPHDWAEHQPWAVGAKERSEAARIAGLASAEARKSRSKKPAFNQPDVNEALNGSLNEPLTDGSTDSQQDGNPRTPSPSPSPLKETTTVRTKTEEMFLESFAAKEQRLKELYPHADFEAEKETCIAHYRMKPPPLDAYELITKWFQRVPKRKPSHARTGWSEQPKKMDSMDDEFWRGVR